jgi:hypothetical protein
VPGIGCGSPRPIGYTHATELLNDGVPFHVVQRLLCAGYARSRRRHSGCGRADVETYLPMLPQIMGWK